MSPTRWLYFASAVVLIGTSGCNMYRSPGSMLPSFAAAVEDRSIEKHASSSSFPSPSDVGLGDSDEDAE